MGPSAILGHRLAVTGNLLETPHLHDRGLRSARSSFPHTCHRRHSRHGYQACLPTSVVAASRIDWQVGCASPFRGLPFHSRCGLHAKSPGPKASAIFRHDCSDLPAGAKRRAGRHSAGKTRRGPGPCGRGTAANVSDVSQTHALVHGEEIDVFGDAGYQGVEKRRENQGFTADWHIAMKRGKRKALPKDAMESSWSDSRSSGQHPCEGRAPVSIVLKISSSTASDATLGSRQNEAQLFSLFGLRNLMLARKRLMALDARYVRQCGDLTGRNIEICASGRNLRPRNNDNSDLCSTTSQPRIPHAYADFVITSALFRVL